MKTLLAGCAAFGICGFGLVAAAPGPAKAAKPHVVHVRPGEALEAVRDAVRALPASNRVHGVEVRLPPGRYALSGPLELGTPDGGTPKAPVVWRSDDGGRAVLCDGVQLPAAAFAPVADAAVRARLDAAARETVRVADLAAYNLPFWKPLTRELRPPTPVPELFCDGVRMTPAEWPNGGEWATIAAFVDEGTRHNEAAWGRGSA